MQLAFWFSIFISVAMGGGLIYYIAMIRQLQLVLHLACLNIMVPANAMYFMASLFKVSAWNIFNIDMAKGDNSVSKTQNLDE
jgi:hypothetical protein